MGRLFGTDGIRGLANADLTGELALAVGAAAARVLGAHAADGRPTAVVGRDPRASGEMLEAAIIAGLTAAGADVISVGVLPTPAVAFLTASLGASFGVMLSASHNPMPDNGIKLFAAGGRKLPDEVEDEISAHVADAQQHRPTGAGIGRVRAHRSDALRAYADHVLATMPVPLTGLTVVVDGANGAASAVSPEVLHRAGATVRTVACEPDGLNINDGVGSTHLGGLQAAVLAAGADLGIAHDGDADRCLAVDAAGNLVDGDQILAIAALALHQAGLLAHDTVVATVMSNLGFRLAMREQGIGVRETSVGDRYVLAEMKAGGFNLGGEQSGHLVYGDHATTGDGLLTALHLMGRMAATGRSLADLAAVMQRLPQVLLNVPVADRAVAGHPDVEAAGQAEQAALGDSGRVLVRASGTEPLVRVMVEAQDAAVAQESADRLAAVVRRVSPV